MRPAWLLPLACILTTTAHARGLTVEDLLANEQYTQVLSAPRAGVVVVGRTRPYKNGDDYRYDWFTRRALSELWTFTAARPTLVRLLGGETGTGYWAAGLSPNGQRLAVFRLRRNRLDLGVVDLARRTVRWARVAPDMPYANPNPAWLDDDHLLLVTRPDRSLPTMFDFAFEPARRSPAAWHKTSKGLRASVSALGSGYMLGQRDRAPPRDLTIYDLRSGSVRRLLQGDIADVLLSPDRRRAAIVRESGDLKIDQTHPADPADLTRAHRLDLVDLPTGRITAACDHCDVLPNLLAWSPSGMQLLFYARSPETPWSKGALLVTTNRGHEYVRPARPFPNFTALIDPAAPGVVAVHARWMGERPVLLGAPWMSSAVSTPVTDWYVSGSHGFQPLTAGAGSSAQVLASAAGHLTYLAKGLLLRGTPEGPPRPLLPDDHIEAAIVPLDPLLYGTRQILNPDPNAVSLVVRHGATSTPIDLSGTGDVRHRYADLPSTVQIIATLPAQNAVLEIANLRGGASTLALLAPGHVTRFGTINRNLSDVIPVPAVVLSDQDQNGHPIYHYLYLPPHRIGALPLVVLPYPGTVLPAVAPASDVAAFMPVANVQLLVSKGYAVLEPSMPLPTVAQAEGKISPLDRIADQIEGAIKVAVATGRIDRTRVAVYGHSYGGYAALAMATHGNVVRSVIASAAPSNLVAAYGVIDPRAKTQDGGISTTIAFGWFEGGQGMLGAPPWVAPERYIEASPLFQAGAMTVPTLLIHGEFDYIPVAGAEQMFMALYRQNKTAFLLRYAAEGHTIRSPANIRDEWRHIFTWLDRMNMPTTASFAVDPGPKLGSGALPVADPRLDRRIEHQRTGNVLP
ncbi:prolyl oligopeptidase family serine peptidase [Sphingomonas sp. PP-CC-3G-468]|uniref:alpha/beta hydrolase family protein n=1 Tax=Sphingomonas sp. PP-CC-3G-468 TaxID=2135656 RepID=UPI0010528B84|nr:prolyl oligopeptidase family serine peptidase [Sphingomonas sp. PP-CC-3G-468]TCM00764.1 prolyl oligopeptidase family protein [Sphingomonas sp. PP-CC-3G-468]